MATADDGYFRTRKGPAVAWRILGAVQRWDPCTALVTDDDGEEYEEALPGEGEWVDDVGSNRVVAVMVGDDRRHTFDRDDLVPLAREDFCGECGQLGCTHDGLDRSEEV